MNSSSDKNYNLRQRTVHGLKWSYFSTFSTAIMQVFYTAVMARLLNPSDFGLVAMGGVVLRFGQYFAQMGMGSAIIQKKDLTKEHISVAFTSSVFLGLIFTSLTFLLAPLAKYVFNNNDVIPLIKIMGVSFLINGFSLTALALIRRNMDFKKLALAEIIAYIIGYMIIGIGSALLGLGVWSLVCASLLQNTILAIFTFFIAKHNIKLNFSWQNYKPLFSFGSKVSVISFLEFIGSSLDTILIGRFFGDKKLGFYNRAQMIISLPMTYLVTTFSRVLFPAFSKVQDDDEKIKKSLFLIYKIMSAFLFPFAVVVCILSKEIVLVILGVKWLASVNILRVLVFAVTAYYIEHILGVLFEAKGFLKVKLQLQSIFLMFLILSFYAFYKFGPIGFAYGLLISEILRFILFSFYLIKRLKIKILDYVKVFSVPLINTAIIASVLILLHKLFTSFSINYITNLITLSLLSLVFFKFLLSLQFNSEIKEFVLNFIKSIFNKKNGGFIFVTKQ